MKLPLKYYGDPVLRQKCNEVTEITDDIRTLVNDMIETMDALNGVGLAANQIGIQKKVALVQVGLKEIWLINPVIVEHEGRIMFKEACLSLPGLPVLTDRYERILLENGLGEERKRESESKERLFSWFWLFLNLSIESHLN